MIIKNFFRKILGIDEILSEVKKEQPVLINAVIRNLLSSIDVGEIDLSSILGDKNVIEDSQKRKQKVANVSPVFLDIIDPLFKELVLRQLLFMGTNSSDVNQFNFSRGTINGLFLLREEIKKMHDEHEFNLREEREKGKHDYNEHNPIGGN